jgi:hypothetical protein
MYAQQPQQQPESFVDRMDGISRILTLIIAGWAATVVIFFRRDFGRNYLALVPGVGVIVLCLFAALTMPLTHMVLFIGYSWLVVAATIYHRLLSLWKSSRGDASHSHYDGWPTLCDRWKLSEQTAKLVVEPIVALLMSIVLLVVHPALAGYVMIGAACIFVMAWSFRCERQKRVEQLRDALIDQDLMNDDFQSLSRRN